MTMLTQQEIAYGQQKNREHIWQQCKCEFVETYGIQPRDGCDLDQFFLDSRYEYLCRQSNIQPW